MKEPHHFHRRFDTQRLLSKKTARMGDKAKPLASQRPAALLSGCPVSVREIDLHLSQYGADV